MKLTSIFLYPDLVEYNSEAARLFRNQTRFICHYLQRHAAIRNVQTDGFNKICIIGKSAPAALTYKNSSKTLIAEVRIDMAEYQALAKEQLPEYFIGLLETGIAQCSRDQHVPEACFRAAIVSFRADDYKDEWVYLAKTFREAGLKCRLHCKLDLEYFRLMLEIERQGLTPVATEILRTVPDEVVYSHRFKDIVLDGDAVVVMDKFGQPLATVPLKGG